MKKNKKNILILATLSTLTGNAYAEEMSFFGTAKIKPTYYSNFDFDDQKEDGVTINEGGLVSGNGAHTRAEVRIGWKAKGDDWSVKVIAESDQTLNKT